VSASPAIFFGARLQEQQVVAWPIRFVSPRLSNTPNCSALASDFSGCGESDDDSLPVAKQVDDLRSAIARAQGFQRIGLFGNSLGTLICLRAYSPEIATMILMGAVTIPSLNCAI
jgi:pimeloyl-ACP methyl ester carboxylesterase